MNLFLKLLGRNPTLILLLICVNAFGYYPNFDDNPLLSKKMKELMGPHLLPLDHLIKPTLDLIFSNPKVTESEQSLREAGFSIFAAMPRSFTFVVKHPLAPGYVFKIHLDSEKKGRYGTPSWEWLTRRCANAAKIRALIQKHDIRYFTVPDKWLYLIPVHSLASQKNLQPAILVATDMEVLTNDESGRAWRTKVTPAHLKELHIILKAGYGSCHLPTNVPFTKHGTFTFIDTEKKPGNLKRLKSYLSDRMASYWVGIVNKS